MTSVDGFNVRATNLLVAAWFLAFSVPLFLFVRDPDVRRSRPDIGAAFADLRQTFTHLRRHRQIMRFLVARLIYNDGLLTIFAFGGIYAAGTFGFTLSEVIVFGIALNVVAGVGAWLFGFVDDQLGGKTTIMISLIFLGLSTLLATFAPDRFWFWVAGIGVGFFLGPNQSASRSLMGRFVPKQHESEFFGFFALSGKVTAFAGPSLLGALSDAYSQRVGVFSVLLFLSRRSGALAQGRRARRPSRKGALSLMANSRSVASRPVSPSCGGTRLSSIALEAWCFARTMHASRSFPSRPARSSCISSPRRFRWRRSVSRSSRRPRDDRWR